jgi:hypothetical protein
MEDPESAQRERGDLMLGEDNEKADDLVNCLKLRERIRLRRNKGKIGRNHWDETAE